MSPNSKALNVKESVKECINNLWFHNPNFARIEPVIINSLEKKDSSSHKQAFTFHFIVCLCAIQNAEYFLPILCLLGHRISAAISNAPLVPLATAHWTYKIVTNVAQIRNVSSIFTSATDSSREVTYALLLNFQCPVPPVSYPVIIDARWYRLCDCEFYKRIQTWMDSATCLCRVHTWTRLQKTMLTITIPNHPFFKIEWYA